MANYTNLNDLFTDIANAIREKTGGTAIIIADTFPTEIDNLRTGFDYANQDVTTIPDYAFYGCEDLNNVDCYNVTRIGTSAFENCTNLKTIILWDGVTDVGENAFKGCSEDLVIYCYFESQPESWNANWNPDGCEVVWLGEVVETWDISATEEDNVITKLCYSEQNSEKYSLIITGKGNMTSYASYSDIPWYSYRTNIESVNIGNSITSISEYAFNNCDSLTSITIPEGVTSINYRTFNSCNNLTSIVIPDSLINIGDEAFCYCNNLSSVVIPNNVTSIGRYSFGYCTSLTYITYKGTISQWNAITFGKYWNSNTPNYIVYCTDGDIAKDGTITYHKTT